MGDGGDGHAGVELRGLGESTNDEQDLCNIGLGRTECVITLDHVDFRLLLVSRILEVEPPLC